MILPMTYWKLSESDIFEHYAAVSDAINIPIMVYNNLGTSGIDMSAEFVAKLFKTLPNVTMLKDSTGDVRRVHQIHQLTDNQLPVYNGCNPIALDMFLAGAKGWFTAAANVIPELNIALYEASKNKQVGQAVEVFHKQYKFLEFILKHGGLPATIKSALELIGVEAGAPRRPMTPPSNTAQQELEGLLEELNVAEVA